jgi:hypothetical protein
MKKVFIAFLLLVACLMFAIRWGAVNYWLTSANFEVSTDHQWHSFVWDSDSSKAVLFIPVRLNHCPRPLLMQLDLGSAKSFLYGKTVEGFNVEYPQKSIAIKDNKAVASLQIDSLQLHPKKDIVVMPEAGNNYLQQPDTIDPKIVVGTLGFDAIVGQTIIIDYPNKKFMLTNRLPDKVVPIAAQCQRFPILLAGKIEGHSQNIWFDTGSSAFALLTTQYLFNKIAPHSAVDTSCCVQAWGKQYAVWQKTMPQALQIGDKSYANVAVSTTERYDFREYLKFQLIGADAITGNYFFLPNTIGIDTRRNKFAIW